MSNQTQDTMRDSRDHWWSNVDTRVLRDNQLSLAARAIFAIICTFATQNNRGAWPKNETIAELAGVSVATLKRAYKELAARGVIARLSRYRDDGSQTSSYSRIVGFHAPCYNEGGSQETPYQLTDEPLPSSPVSHEVNPNEVIKDSLTRGNTPSAEILTAESPNTPDQESTITPEQEKPPVKAEDSQTLDKVPEAMRPTAEYFLLKTGRKSLTEKYLSALIELDAHQMPNRVQKEIATACERFKRKGHSLDTLTFEYIASSLRNQPTRGRQAQSQKAKRKHDPLALTQAEIDSVQHKYTHEDMKRAEEMLRAKILQAQEEARKASMNPDQWVEVY